MQCLPTGTKQHMDCLKTKFENKYPELFKKSELVFGFECREGWNNLIEAVCAIACQRLNDIKWRLGIYKERPEAEQLKIDLEEAIKDLPSFLQIKEKFGTLRIYTGGATPEVQGAIAVAELLSAVTCEHCGCKGTRWNIGWIHTLCRPCAIENYTEKAVIEYEKLYSESGTENI